jgi:hypothetical protein
MKNCLLVLAIVLVGHFDCYAQPTWEKVPANIAKAENEQSAAATTKPYKDKNYNYGSETNQSPRTDAVTWADPKGTLWLFGGSGLNQNQARELNLFSFRDIDRTFQRASGGIIVRRKFA